MSGIDLSCYSNNTFSRGVSRWVELLWWIVRSLFFCTSIPLPSFLKVTLLRLFGAKVGRGVVIRSNVFITFPWRLSIGDHVWIGDQVLLLSLERIEIDSHCCISQRAFLCTGSHDFTKTTFDLIISSIRIERGCWVGAQAFVGPGVVMESGSRALAGAVVVKSVPAGVCVGGVPAKPLQ